jgi:DNA-binding transcriptional regulator YiaG
MKWIILLILMTAPPLYSFAQDNPGITKIHILGLIHTGNNQFGEKELQAELERLQPDIILWEQSIPYKRVFGLRTAHFLNIWQPGIEQLALQSYTRRKRNCLVLPYDTVIADRHQYIKNLQQNRSQLFQHLSKAAMTPEDSSSLAAHLEERHANYSGLLNKSIMQINAATEIEKIRQQYQFEEKVLSDIVMKYCTDTTLRNWYLKERQFWISRNQYMAKKIEVIASTHPYRKIVVLTGLHHKYLLMDYLNANASSRWQWWDAYENIKVMEKDASF